ncbi:SGNH hydrolase-type esterase domain-containing protein [Boletus edulis BED1]|uniref:SGNH hydrolase-type esterase domain-containing protein n=1 Tax=Boletus edulis BED1 TaxID=1328754 RepID=A0AAD4C951_BOLED|nr:SGNH hydrolase-type esterase domain-containing protein [Boletus edulis BED1]
MALACTQDVILLLGDSLTQGNAERAGLAERLSSVYVRKMDVINRGLSGYQTDWAIPVFEQILAQQHAHRHAPKVQLLTLWFGANDAALPPSTQHVPIARFKSNLVHLVHMVRSPTSAYYSPGTRIVLITPPPVNTSQWTSERGFEETKQYAEAVREVGGQVGVPVADVWTLVWEGAGRDERGCERFLQDGLHLNAAGYEIVFDAVMKIIEETYPEMHYEKLQTVFVPWSEVNVGDPRPSLVKRRAMI